MTLADLKPGQRANVSSVETDSSHQSRLYQLGLIPGSAVHVLRKAPLGDPLQIQIDGTLLSIRKLDAQMIRVSEA